MLAQSIKAYRQWRHSMRWYLRSLCVRRDLKRCNLATFTMKLKIVGEWKNIFQHRKLTCVNLHDSNSFKIFIKTKKTTP